MKVYERDGIVKQLEKRDLLRQYLKAVHLLEAGYAKNVHLKVRNPKSDGIFQFRINKQFRAYCYFENPEKLIVVKINNHQ